MQYRSGAERHRPLHRVLQFAHISRPVVSHQPPHGIFRNGANGPQRIAEFLQKKTDQQRNIALAFSQRRQFDLHHVQPEIEVLPEGAGANGGFQIAIGGRNDADIDTQPVRGSHGPDLAFL